jgi:hypothetical protein
MGPSQVAKGREARGGLASSLTLGVASVLKKQASCAQAGTFVIFAQYGNKSVSYKTVGTNPINLFTIHLLGRATP